MDSAPPNRAFPERLSAFHDAQKLDRWLKKIFLSIAIFSAMLAVCEQGRAGSSEIGDTGN